MVSFGFAQDKLLTTDGVVSLEIEYLSVHPELSRRAPRKFSHSPAQGDLPDSPVTDRRKISLFVRNDISPNCHPESNEGSRLCLGRNFQGEIPHFVRNDRKTKNVTI